MVVIGGGDTGSDCIGTSIRQGAKSVTNFEIMPQPPERENKALTWPDWPLKLRTSSSHEEGVEREFAVLTQKFSGEERQGEEAALRDGRRTRSSRCRAANSSINADLVLLAMGFVHPVQEGMLESLGIALDPRGNAKAIDRGLQDLGRRRCSPPATCAAGNRSWSGRSAKAANARNAIDTFLMGSSTLPR